MTDWYFDTCHCVGEVETSKLLKKCRSHDTFAETLAHERAIMLTHGRNTTESQKDTIRDLALAEKKKPIYQRR